MFELRRALLTVTAVFFWVIALETAARIGVDQFGSTLAKTMRVLQADPVLGWRQRPNLNRSFFGAKVVTDANGFRSADRGAWNKSELRVLLLGPSSAFGWGVENDATYARQLQRLLSESTGKAVSVFNASQIGHSSWQGRRLFESPLFAEARPDIVLLAYGVNDYDRFRFFFASDKPDKVELAKPRDVSLQNGLMSHAFPQIMHQATQAVLSAVTCRDTGEIPHKRVSRQDVFANFSAMIQEARKRGARVMVINTPYELNRFASEPDLDVLHRQLHLVEQKIEQGELNQAARALQDLKKDHARISQVHYLASAVLSRQGDCRAAQKAFEKGRELEPWRLYAELNDFNTGLERFSRNQRVLFIDAHALIGGRPEMFVDPVHPSAAGHKTIAAEIFKQLRSGKYGNNQNG